MAPVPRHRIAALLPCLIILAGCREDDVRVYEIVKEAPAATPAGLPAGHPQIPDGGTPGMGGGEMGGGGMGMGELPGGADEAAPREIAWTVPAGWTEKPGSGMRVATIAIKAGGGSAELSVVALAGMAGGMLANINRWRGQLGLPEIGEAQLGKTASKVASPAGEVTVVEFTGAGGKGSLFGGVLTAKGRTWFFKATGTAAVLAAARNDLLGFMKGLHAH